MWWWLTASALASPVLEVFTNNQAVEGVLSATVENTPVTLRDNGSAPDRVAGDGYWSGALPGAPGIGRFQRLEVRDAAGHTWSGGVEWTSDDPPVGQVGLERDGTLIKPPFPSPAAVPSLREDGTTPSDPGAPPTSSGSSGGSDSGGLGWLLAALGWGLFIAAALRQIRAEPTAVPGTPSPLAAGLQKVSADPSEASRLLGWLAQQHRVILLGEVGAAVPAGTVFVPRSHDLGDVTALVEALSGRGRPLAVLILGASPGAEALAEGLSDLPVLWATASGSVTVGEDGALVPA